MRVYIASPYTKGDSALNVRRQIDAFNELMKRGHAPFAPLLSHFVHMVHPQLYEAWMTWDFEWVKQCDVILRLSGESSGADREVELAKRLGKVVIYSMDELDNYHENYK